MAHSFESCAGCGAPLRVTEGGGVECQYCGAAESRGVDPARLAAALRAEAGSIADLFERLGAMLTDALPDETTAEWSGGLLSRRKLEAVQVDLGSARLRAKRQGNGVVAHRQEVVGGIVLKTDTLPLHDWLEHLARGLSERAAESTRARDALRRGIGR